MDADTLRPPFRPGVRVYCDSRDVMHPKETVAKLRRCACVEALPLIEGVNGHRVSVDVLRDFVDEAAAADITCMPFSFPAVNGELARSIDHFLACKRETRCRMQWDVEPLPIGGGRVMHWSQAMLDKLLAADPDATITSTRAELPRFDARGRLVYLQLESQTSTDTLEHVLRQWPDAVLVTGLFDNEGDPRTIDEVLRDLERCTPQAKRTGAHVLWSAHTMSELEADRIAAWAIETWAPPRAA